MGGEFAALSGFFGLTSLFAVVAAAFGGWMAWRIVEKSGLPGWLGLVAMLLTLTGIGSIVPLVLLWIFAFMDWPRDAAAGTPARPQAPPSGGPPTPAAPAAPPPLGGPRSDRRRRGTGAPRGRRGSAGGLR